MQLERLINPVNVVKAARFILELNKSAIEESMQHDVHDAITWLKDCLEHYLHPVDGWPGSGLNRIDYHEKQLKALIKAVRSLLPYLTLNAQAQLKQFLIGEEPLNDSTPALPPHPSQQRP